MVLVGLCVGSIFEDLRTDEWRGWIAVDVVTIATWILLVMAYFQPSVVEGIGVWIVAVFLVPLLGTGLSVQHDLATTESDPRLSVRTNEIIHHLGAITAAALLVPAVAFGVLVVMRAL